MARRKPFTSEEKETICKMWGDGYTATQICRQVYSLHCRKPQTLYPVLIKAGLYKKKPANDLRRFNVNDNYFDKIDTEHKAYWLGFMLADGFLSNAGHAKKSFGIAIKASDRYLLEQFKKDLNSTYNIHEYEEVHEWGNGPRKSTVAKLLIKSKNIFQKLEKMGFTTDKSHNAILPINWVPKKLWNHLIRGYFDGDGSLAKAGDKRWHTYDLKFTGSKEVITSIRSILNKDNVKLRKRFPDRDNNNCMLNLCGDLQVYNICKWMYKDATIYLKRKYDRFKELEKKYIS